MQTPLQQVLDIVRKRAQAFPGHSELAYSIDRGIALANGEDDALIESTPTEATFCITSEVVDRDGDLIHIDGLDFTNWKRAGAMWMLHHKSGEGLPIGTSIGSDRKLYIWHEGNQLFGTIFFDMDDPLARWVARKVKKYGMAASLAFVPTRWQRRDYSKAAYDNPRPDNAGLEFFNADVSEISIVCCPSNPLAVMQAVKSADCPGRICKALRPWTDRGLWYTDESNIALAFENNNKALRRAMNKAFGEREPTCECANCHATHKCPCMKQCACAARKSRGGLTKAEAQARSTLESLIRHNHSAMQWIVESAATLEDNEPNVPPGLMASMLEHRRSIRASLGFLVQKYDELFGGNMSTVSPSLGRSSKGLGQSELPDSAVPIDLVDGVNPDSSWDGQRQEIMNRYGDDPEDDLELILERYRFPGTDSGPHPEGASLIPARKRGRKTATTDIDVGGPRANYDRQEGATYKCPRCKTVMVRKRQALVCPNCGYGSRRS
jgi:hypothetical protein